MISHNCLLYYLSVVLVMNVTVSVSSLSGRLARLVSLASNIINRNLL